jgi:hypothetical protein
MGDQSTNPADASGDAGPDYAAKYQGLMQAFSKRTNEFAEKEQAWAAREADLEARAARLAEFEAAEAAQAEEQEFERLAQERGFGRVQTPLRHGGTADRLTAANGGDDGSAKALREKVERGEFFTGKPTKLSGWPT